jgi:hypothetical protein
VSSSPLAILIDYVAVYAVLADDDAVEVIYLELS